MLAKIWKKLFLIICIIAIIFNIGHKLISRTSLKEQLIQLATTESLSTSIKNFVKEKYGDLTDKDKKEFSDPVGEIIDVYSNDANSDNTINPDNTMSEIDATNNINEDVTPVDGQNSENTPNNDNVEENESEPKENGFTKFVQNIKTDIDDNPYFNDDPTDDLIDTTPPTF